MAKIWKFFDPFTQIGKFPHPRSYNVTSYLKIPRPDPRSHWLNAVKHLNVFFFFWMKAFICFILCSHLPSLYQWEVLQNVIIEQASCEPCSSGYLIIEFSWFDGFTIYTQLFESSHPIIFLRGHVSIPIVRFSPRSNSLFTFNEKK